jgi:triacylglycerol lipase
MNDVINSTATSGAQYGPVIDGDLIVASAATQLEQGNFVRVPYLLGCNSDEGTGFGPQQINTTKQFLDVVQEEESFDMATAQDLAILYPDIPNIGIPATFPGRPNGTFGSQFKRTSALFGDLGMHGPRRWTAHQWAKNGATAFTYRFNVVVCVGLVAFVVLLGASRSC